MGNEPAATAGKGECVLRVGLGIISYNKEGFHLMTCW